jgi:hypothetical protein
MRIAIRQSKTATWLGAFILATIFGVLALGQVTAISNRHFVFWFPLK